MCEDIIMKYSYVQPHTWFQSCSGKQQWILDYILMAYLFARVIHELPTLMYLVICVLICLIYDLITHCHKKYWLISSLINTVFVLLNYLEKNCIHECAVVQKRLIKFISYNTLCSSFELSWSHKYSVWVILNRTSLYCVEMYGNIPSSLVL